MKKVKPKGSSFSKSSTKAETAAYNTKNKVRVAKGALAKKNKEIEQTRKNITRNIKNQRAAENKGYKNLSNVYGKNVEYYTLEKMPEQKAIKGKISQALTDRTRSASRAAGMTSPRKQALARGIAAQKRFTKKGKK